MIRRGREGFSLIEALVALAIAAMTLTAIFELQIQMARGQRRAAEALDQVAAQENALAMLSSLNPMEQPSGDIRIPNGDTIRWTSVAQGQPVRAAAFPTGDAGYEVQRFTVTVQIERPSGRSPGPLVFDRVGWRG
ncbi:type II secretion system protein [Brevundimonas staleyi]|uniref:Type II secretion system protein n=1 Tax=Brevundimonas staleyi TaxID=74326 RepID=A0ABW0FTI5_9CAUL